jgi:formylglycine-generating enzyme required for sulfatase activity
MDMSATGFRLPTEMEWEWAAMGGGVPDTAAGTTWTTSTAVLQSGHSKLFAGYDGTNTIDSYAWYHGNNSPSGIAQVGTAGTGSKTSLALSSYYWNELGLYDMSGNIWEWCYDWRSNWPDGLVTDYTGPSVDTAAMSTHLRRGGNWDNDAGDCTVHSQSISADSVCKVDDSSFRVVCKGQ